MDRYSELIKRHYPITSDFFSKVEFSELSKLYFKQFPLEINLEKDNTFYFPLFLKSLKKEKNIPEFLYELADFEVSSQQISELPDDESHAMAQLQPGDVRLNPILSVHRFENDILSFVEDLKKGIKKTNPNPQPNITLITRDKCKNVIYLKASPQIACIVDYLSEGQMSERILSAQLIKNFPQFFKDEKSVQSVLQELHKDFVTLEIQS